MRRIIVIVVFWLLAARTVLLREARAAPQESQIQQNQSVVDAAQRSRELKKNAARPPRVITNDDLDRQLPRRVQEDFRAAALATPQTDLANVNTAAVPKADFQGTAHTSNDSGLKNNETEEAAAEDAEIARLKAQLALAENALKWQQRELLLKQNTIYSNPAYTTTHTGKAQLDSAKLEIEQTQREIDALKGPLADLEWRKYRRMQAGHSENGAVPENYKSVPPPALVLPHP